MPLWPPRRGGFRVALGSPPEGPSPTTATPAQHHRRGRSRKSSGGGRSIKDPRQEAYAPQADEVSEVVQQVRIWAMEEGWQRLLRHPDLLDELCIGFVAKELGVNPPKLPTWEERMIDEVRADPEYRRGEIDRIVEGRKLDNLFHQLKKMGRIATRMGWKKEEARKDGSGEVAKAVKDFVAGGGLKDLVKAIGEAQRKRTAVQTAGPVPATTATPPGRPAGESGETKKADSPAPSPPGLVRPRQPVRRSVGVPPEALGLLGLGQDNTFIDQPLV